MKIVKQERNDMKRILFLTLIFIIAFSLFSCGNNYREIYYGDFSIYENTKGNDCFVGAYLWDGHQDNMVITIPESYNGKNIDALGGYIGIGNPIPFFVNFRRDVFTDCTFIPNYEAWRSLSYTEENSQIIYLDFTLELGKNITKINETMLTDVWHFRCNDDSDTAYKLYVPRFYVSVTGEIDRLYAKDGKLYLREDDSLYSCINYWDFQYQFDNKS